MTARYQQRQKWKTGRVGLEQRRQQVPLQVVYAHRWPAPGGAQGRSKASPHQQGANETWARGIGNPVDRLPAGSGIGQNLPNQRQKTPNMVAGSQFGYHAPVSLVHCDLAVQSVGEQAHIGVVDGHGRLVTGALDAQYPHKPNPRLPRGLCLLWERTLECAPLSPNLGGRAIHLRFECPAFEFARMSILTPPCVASSVPVKKRASSPSSGDVNSTRSPPKSVSEKRPPR